MKLLFVHDFPVEYYKETDEYFSTGFPYNLWKRYLNEFDQVNVSCRVVNIDNTDGKVKSDGPNVEFFPIKSYQNAQSLITKKKSIEHELLEAINKSDAVLIRIPSVLGFIAAKLCRKLNKRYMVEVVGASFDAYWNFGTMTGKLLAVPMDLAQKKASKNASVANYVTKYYLQRKYPTSGVSINGLTDVELFKSRNQNLPDYKDRKILIGLIGSTFTKYKGHELALKAVSELKREGYEVEIQLVGQGLSESVQKIIKDLNLEDNVKYMGVIYDRNKLYNWFQNLHVYIQPSKTEGLCRSIMEAISLNVVTLASNVGGNTEIVDKKYTFSSSNHKELTNLLMKALNDEVFREHNRTANKKMLEQFDFFNVAHRREKSFKIYKNILGGAK